MPTGELVDPHLSNRRSRSRYAAAQFAYDSAIEVTTTRRALLPVRHNISLIAYRQAPRITMVAALGLVEGSCLFRRTQNLLSPAKASTRIQNLERGFAEE